MYLISILFPEGRLLFVGSLPRTSHSSIPNLSKRIFLLVAGKKRKKSRTGRLEDAESYTTPIVSPSKSRNTATVKPKRSMKGLEIKLDIIPMTGEATIAKKKHKKKKHSSNADVLSHGADLTHHSDNKKDRHHKT